MVGHQDFLMAHHDKWVYSKKSDAKVGAQVDCFT